MSRVKFPVDEKNFSGVKVDSAIKLVLFGVKFHLVSSCFMFTCFVVEKDCTISCEETLNSIKSFERDRERQRLFWTTSFGEILAP